ncbi:hypothetical protein SAMN03159335_05415 [Burkholderia cepacia]|uniref:hypothetical protein n=1 Tax=Burkholderia cepacia TaxID=292 RepID=UPI0008B15337|nr:hypothetical protein [Burkholderia cepacia]SEU36292.1 hypothetical protein SAMN03159335_05415 [Burkholderia cepacia]
MNCKVGDMAVITRGGARDRIVEVKAPYGDYLHLGFCWYVEAPTPIPATDVVTFEPCEVKTGWIPDAWLRPINGVPMTDDVTDEVSA